MKVISRWVAAILGHLHDQERSQSGATDGGNDAQYDDRESMPPFLQEEQRLERLSHQRPSQNNHGDTSHQRDLVKWTRNLAYTTGGLAIATVLVAFFAGWQAWETRSAGVDTKNAVEATNRLANAAEAGERAYVLFAGLEAFSFVPHEDPSLIKWNIAPLVENSGNTPTSDLRAKAISCYRTADLPRDFSFPDIAGDSVPIDLGPKQKMGIQGLEIPDAVLPGTHNCADAECDEQEKERPPANGERALVSCKAYAVLEKKK
jgi:hypothetical protein